jgi:hypothetical protein
MTPSDAVRGCAQPPRPASAPSVPESTRGAASEFGTQGLHQADGSDGCVPGPQGVHAPLLQPARRITVREAVATQFNQARIMEPPVWAQAAREAAFTLTSS